MSFQVQTGGPVSQVTFKWAAPPLLVREEVNKAVGVEEEEDWARAVTVSFCLQKQILPQFCLQ